MDNIADLNKLIDNMSENQEKVEVLEPKPEKKEEPKLEIIEKQKENNMTFFEEFSQNYRIATQLAKSSIIPQNYQNKPENVIVALGLSQKMGLDAFTVMQNLNIIKGKTSWSGSFCKTLIERTGKFKDLNLNYIGEKGKDSYGCYLSATRISDNAIIKGPEVTMKMAREEKWTSNSKWLTLTDIMLAYRCQSFFARVHCPEAMNGIYTSEEIEETFGTQKREIKDVL